MLNAYPLDVALPAAGSVSPRIFTPPAPPSAKPSAGPAALRAQILGITATEPYHPVAETIAVAFHQIGLTVLDALRVADELASSASRTTHIDVRTLAHATGLEFESVFALIANLIDADDIRTIDAGAAGTRAHFVGTVLSDPEGSIVGRPHDALLYYIDARLRDTHATPYLEHRGRWLEEEIGRLMTHAGRDAHTAQQVMWKTPNAAGEIDALTQWNQIGIRWQAKSTLHPQNMLRDVRHALRQHRRLRAAMCDPKFRLTQPTARDRLALASSVSIDAIVTLQPATNSLELDTLSARRLHQARSTALPHLLLSIGELQEAAARVGDRLIPLLVLAHRETIWTGTHRPLLDIAASHPRLQPDRPTRSQRLAHAR